MPVLSAVVLKSGRGKKAMVFGAEGGGVGGRGGGHAAASSRLAGEQDSATLYWRPF